MWVIRIRILTGSRLKNSRETHSLIAISTGGGMMEVLSIDGVELHMDGGYHETLIWLDKTINAAPNCGPIEMIDHSRLGWRAASGQISSEFRRKA
jgi:hypothetical protein